VTHHLVITPEQHATAGWRRFTNYCFAQQEHLCPVARPELTQLLPWYTLAFIADESQQRFHLVALLSLQPQQNAYIDAAGRWLAPYVPAHLRSYPFGMNAEGRLTVDTESELFQETCEEGCEPFYGADGRESEALGKITEFCRQRLSGMALAQKLTTQLADAEVLEPWPITWQKGDQPQGIKGYYRVNEQKLHALSPEDCAEFTRSGAMGLAYAQVFSQARLADLKYREAKKQAASPAAVADNLEQLFGGGDDTLKFNF
jgi:hypothetical protein